jgi:hypothetical protein
MLEEEKEHVHSFTEQDLDELQMHHEMRAPPTRPPAFELLMNGVRGLTKRVDHLNVQILTKGFKFDIGGSLSNNMHVSGSFNMPNPSLPKKSPYGMP